jgi:hypothetical protein
LTFVAARLPTVDLTWTKAVSTAGAKSGGRLWGLGGNSTKKSHPFTSLPGREVSAPPSVHFSEKNFSAQMARFFNDASLKY